MKIRLFFSVFLIATLSSNLAGQNVLRYKGTQQSNVNFHDGQLPHAIGVHNVQVMRANRQHSGLADGYGWTYNHNQNICFWNGKFYVHYLSTPYAEHYQPGQTMLTTSADGYSWSFPKVIFPQYELPVGYKKAGGKESVFPGMHSVMHQRMGFYVTKKNRLLTFGYYGISFGTGDNPNRGDGIGRVVREIYADGSFGNIYFIRYNKGFSEKNTHYPFYTSCKEKGFIDACNEVLANKLIIMQWREEADRDDTLVSFHETSALGAVGVNRAFNFYHLADGRVVGLWKHAMYSISNDEGKTWSAVKAAENVIDGGAKFWGQKTSDGRYAIAYTPDEGKRFPLALMTSDDGLNYNNLVCLHGEVSPLRYIGAFKDFGPQYVRGIIEGNGTPPDGKLWLVYSMNKEDIWVSSVAVPVTSTETQDINELFNDLPAGEELNKWNTYSPVWAPARIEKDSLGIRNLVLRDKDRYDFSKAERLFKNSPKISLEFEVKPLQNDGTLFIEITDRKGEAAITLLLDQKGEFRISNKQSIQGFGKYKSGDFNTIGLRIDEDGFYSIVFNGKERSGLRLSSFFLEPLERVVFRTGPRRTFPDASPDNLLMEGPEFRDLPYAGEPEYETVFIINRLTVKGK